MFTNKEKIEFFNAVEDGDIQQIKYLLDKNNYISINVFGIAKIKMLLKKKILKLILRIKMDILL